MAHTSTQHGEPNSTNRKALDKLRSFNLITMRMKKKRKSQKGTNHLALTMITIKRGNIYNNSYNLIV